MNVIYIKTISFLMPILSFIFVLSLLKIYPFGDKSLLSLDLNTQYVAFFAFIKEIIRDPSSIFYTFSKTMGGDSIGLLSYYLFSPFNFITLFFSNEKLVDAITIISILKIGLAGLSFNIYIKGRDFKSILFSFLYAMMGFSIANLSNIMWLDAIIMLPLITKGIELIIDNKKSTLYIVTLTYAIITNYYMGFMICIFSLLYFIYYLIIKFDHISEINRNDIFLYIFSSLISVGIAAFILVPTYFSLKSTKEILEFSSLSIGFNFGIKEFLSKTFIGALSFDEIVNGLPVFYCGLITILCSVYYFLSNSILKKEKICSIIFILVLIVSFIFIPFNMIWHGFAKPNWFPYRYSFILSFFLLKIGFNGYSFFEKRQFNKRYFITTMALVIIILAFVATGSYNYLNTTKIIITFIFILLYFFIILFLKYNSIIRRILIFSIVFFEISINTYFYMKVIPYQSISEYENFVNFIEPILSDIRESDSGFYRFEKTFNRSHNDPFLLNYMGLSHNSSAEGSKVRSYLFSELGFSSEDNWVNYNTGTTYANDSLLGIKYLLTTENMDSDYYSKINDYDEYSLYLNNYALPLAIIVNDDVFSYESGTFSWLNNQNTIWNLLNKGQDKDIMEKIEEGIPIFHDIEVVGMSDSNTIYKANNDNGFIEYSFIMKDNGPLFGYLNSDDEKQIEIIINDNLKKDYFTYGENQIVRLGVYSKGDRVTMKIFLKESTACIKSINLFVQKTEDFVHIFNNITDNKFKLDKFNNAFILGTINANENGNLMFNIPYDENWRVYVNGSIIETKEALGLFLTVPIESGANTIKLYYVPKGIIVGSVVSVSTLLMLIGLYLHDARRNK